MIRLAVWCVAILSSVKICCSERGNSLGITADTEQVEVVVLRDEEGSMREDADGFHITPAGGIQGIREHLVDHRRRTRYHGADDGVELIAQVLERQANVLDQQRADNLASGRIARRQGIIALVLSAVSLLGTGASFLYTTYQ